MSRDLVDVVLVQIYQRKHVRHDAFAIRRNALRRHDDRAIASLDGSEIAENGCGENIAHIQSVSKPTQTIDHGNRQERMATKLEEVIAATDASDPEQFLPHGGDRA
ncbi:MULTISPECIES: hypothetical protein, partial [unclassified Rhodanobacter]|uniref:hypothetical protein n=1 Tax=unclassified Rhodanobacter TaxID=2621553 RepID=UPI00180F0CF3